MSGAGCSRVTHPFATRVLRRALPFDLHVLSTPPAFVLSQESLLSTLRLTLTQTHCWIFINHHQRNRYGRTLSPTATGAQRNVLLALTLSTLLSSQVSGASPAGPFRLLRGATRITLVGLFVGVKPAHFPTSWRYSPRFVNSYESLTINGECCSDPADRPLRTLCPGGSWTLVERFASSVAPARLGIHYGLRGAASNRVGHSGVSPAVRGASLLAGARSTVTAPTVRLPRLTMT